MSAVLPADRLAKLKAQVAVHQHALGQFLNPSTTRISKPEFLDLSDVPLPESPLGIRRNRGESDDEFVRRATQVFTEDEISRAGRLFGEMLASMPVASTTGYATRLQRLNDALTPVFELSAPDKTPFTASIARERARVGLADAEHVLSQTPVSGDVGINLVLGSLLARIRTARTVVDGAFPQLATTPIAPARHALGGITTYLLHEANAQTSPSAVAGRAALDVSRWIDAQRAGISAGGAAEGARLVQRIFADASGMHAVAASAQVNDLGERVAMFLQVHKLLELGDAVRLVVSGRGDAERRWAERVAEDIAPVRAQVNSELRGASNQFLALGADEARAQLAAAAVHAVAARDAIPRAAMSTA